MAGAMTEPGSANQAAVDPAAPVLFSIVDGLATLTLNRPQHLNGLTSTMARQMRDAVLEVQRRSDVRVLLLQGAGARFCAGVDLGWLLPEEPGCDQRMRDTLDGLGSFVQTVRELPAIVVAAVQGAAAGGGFALMCAADLVLASDDARLSTAYTRIGGTPDCGLSYLLPRLVGERKAMELLLLSDPLDAATALHLGLVNQVAPAAQFPAVVDALVRRLLQGPGQALARTKRLVTQALDQSFPAQLESELQGMLNAQACGEMLEGVRAFRQKRPALYQPSGDR
jgi:2-(1,2-epoxy-1,2-dihydrophenyl)acetyl-CoA isomerase